MWVELITGFNPLIDFRRVSLKDAIKGAEMLAEEKIEGHVYKLYNNDVMTVNEEPTDIRQPTVHKWWCLSNDHLMYYKEHYKDNNDLNGGEWCIWVGDMRNEEVWQKGFDSLIFQLLLEEHLVEE